MVNTDSRYYGSWKINMHRNDLKNIADPELRLKYEYDKLTDKLFAGGLNHTERDRLNELGRIMKS